ncbi:hypothetical protein XBP1_2520002 [Xenorhabdus bovienii str. puntauvense]|uniref:Uncharacterized protein n=2 Tax=Xenorhabdus bovienii TaxID=40576 RepID=A0A077NHB1_XENBV|nr:hypothetical protein XBP1_2520002 [Xenorhabdus bovienii str. puntauvense]CDH22844.1 hypothetical protein XBKB1_1380005 [Xenorhabdus bovienii str. kraussei Becker Underwood]
MVVKFLREPATLNFMGGRLQLKAPQLPVGDTQEIMSLWEESVLF